MLRFEASTTKDHLSRQAFICQNTWIKQKILDKICYSHIFKLCALTATSNVCKNVTNQVNLIKIVRSMVSNTGQF